MDDDTQGRKDQSGQSSPNDRPKAGEESGRDTLGPDAIKVDAKRAAVGGALAAATALVGMWLVGEASGAEARILLETSLPSTRSFCGTLTLALGNILALMLTLLSLSTGTDIELKWAHYQRVKQIALIDTVVLVGAVLIYLLLNVPLGEAEAAEGPRPPFAALYYGTLVASSLLAGALIAIALMLYNAVRDIIYAVGPERESPLIRSEEA